MDEVKIWSVDGDSNVEPLVSKVQTHTEQLLEDILVKKPDLLIPGLKLVGRQTPTAGGPLDLLGVDKYGRLALFELKRSKVTREAVAQVIDYAADLEAMDLAELATLISKESGKLGICKITDFDEWYSQEFPDQELASLRPLRMFLVGLGADDRAERMVDFLANDGSLYISLVTFHSFEYEDKTLLAKQVHIEKTEDAEPRSAKRYLSAAEKRERLAARVEEYGITDLFDAVRAMFRGNWDRSSENIGPASIGIYLSHQAEPSRRAYARIDSEEGRVGIVFYGRAVSLCPEEFDQVKQAFQFETWRGPSDVEGVYEELKLPVDHPAWEANRELLSSLTKDVYAAWESSGQEEGSS